jgi:aminopeptidase YwaD
VPSLLNWHFTDRYYHTNQDRPDKVSAAEMQNVGIAVGTSAWLLASASPDDAVAVAALVEQAASARFALERTQRRSIVAGASDKIAAEITEKQVLAAWIKWYGEALDSVLRLPTTGETHSLADQVALAKHRIR